MAPRDFSRLAQHVKARRLELGLALKKAANDAAISKDTWIRVEKGAPLREISYAKMEPVLQWAPGSCVAVLEGRSAITADPSRAGAEVVVSTIPREAIDAEARDVVQLAMIATTKGMTAEEIRALSDRVVHDLRERGII